MTLIRRLPVLAVAGLLTSALPAFAGWNTVFQSTCCDKPRVAQKPACDTCAPRTSQKVEYQTSTYYEPVTVMKPVTEVYEVPVQVKSYYWEPVTTYTYRSYYDSCSNTCQQIQVPRTSYVRKEECNTVMKAVERMKMVPVQVEREVRVTRPVITTYGPEVRQYGPLTPVTPGPRIEQQRSPSVIQEGDRIAPPNVPSTPGGTSNPKTTVPTPMPAQSNFRPNAMTTSAIKETNGRIEGEIVKPDQATPLSKAKIVFVNAANNDQREYFTADNFGQFEARLPAGEWLMYVGPGDGKANYHSKVMVKEGNTRSVTVASR